MKTFGELINERQILRDAVIESIRNRTQSSEKTKRLINKLHYTHRQILLFEMQNTQTIKVRFKYDIVAWCPDKGYFKDILISSFNLQTAKKQFSKISKSPDTIVPVILIMSTYYRNTFTTLSDFDTDALTYVNADSQYLLSKSLANSKGYRLRGLIDRFAYRFTY